MLLTVVVVEQISFLKTYDFYKYITTMTLTVYYLELVEFFTLTSYISYIINIQHIHRIIIYVQYSEMMVPTVSQKVETNIFNIFLRC